MSIFIRKMVRNSKIGGFGGKKSSKFEEIPIINIYSLLVPQIDHPVALCPTPSAFTNTTSRTLIAYLTAYNLTG